MQDVSGKEIVFFGLSNSRRTVVLDLSWEGAGCQNPQLTIAAAASIPPGKQPPPSQ